MGENPKPSQPYCWGDLRVITEMSIDMTSAEVVMETVYYFLKNNVDGRQSDVSAKQRQTLEEK